MPLAFYQLAGTTHKGPEFQKYTKKVVCRICNFNSFLKSFLNSAKPFTTVPFEKTKKLSQLLIICTFLYILEYYA